MSSSSRTARQRQPCFGGGLHHTGRKVASKSWHSTASREAPRCYRQAPEPWRYHRSLPRLRNGAPRVCREPWIAGAALELQDSADRISYRKPNSATMSRIAAGSRLGMREGSPGPSARELPATRTSMAPGAPCGPRQSPDRACHPTSPSSRAAMVPARPNPPVQWTIEAARHGITT
jgi:hypothetical protein